MVTTHRFEPTTATLYNENGVFASVSRDKHVYESRISDPVSGSWVTLPGGSRFRAPTSYARREAGIRNFTPYFQHGVAGPPDFNPRDVKFSPGGYDDDCLMSANCPPFPGNTITQLNSSYPTEIPFAMINEAAVKALNKIADQKANIGEDLATFRQTVTLFKNPSQSLWESLKETWADKSLRPFLNRTVRDIRRDGPLTALSRKYLEIVYGWNPLMQDIYGVYVLAKEQSVKAMLLSAEGKSNRNLQGGGSEFHDFSNATTTKWISTNEDAKVRCKLYGRIDPNHAGLRALNQLGLLNPVSLAWELVNWSFVVDWFCPVGAVLNAFTAPAGLSFVSGTKSVRGTFRGTYENWRDPFGNIISESRATGEAYANVYRRELFGEWPLPGFWFVENPFTQDHVLKALALSIMNLRNLPHDGGRIRI